MKKIIIAAVIVFASGVTAMSVTKSAETSDKVDVSTVKADMTVKSKINVKQDIGTIQ